VCVRERGLSDGRKSAHTPAASAVVTAGHEPHHARVKEGADRFPNVPRACMPSLRRTSPRARTERASERARERERERERESVCV